MLFYPDNGSDVQIVYVKYNKIINSSDIKGKADLGETFVDWYEIVDVKDGKDILAEKPFDFKTKINRNVKLKLPTEPSKAGYKFVVWEDKNGTPIYNDALLSEATTLYAKWEKIEEDKTTTKEETKTKKDNRNTVSYY